MWRPTMLLLCLIAALAGGPLRQAEAAGDLARSLSELGGGDVIETIDGGVGDDSGESILTATDAHAGLDPATDPPSLDHLITSPPPIAPSRLPGAGVFRPSDPSGGPVADPARRHAWLQSFRF